MSPKDYIYDRFLSENVNKRTYTFKSLPNSEKIEKEDADFIYFKSDVMDFASHQKLFKMGFNIIDINITLKRNYQISDSFSLNTNIRHAKSSDEEKVREIAHKSFIFDRFHKDKKISNVIASNIKEKWASNFFTGQRGDCMFVAELKSHVAGFLLLILSNKELIIDLIATDKNYREQGIGKQLVQAGINMSKNDKKDFVVTTQKTNVESLSFYKNLGFQVFKKNYVWHWHKK